MSNRLYNQKDIESKPKFGFWYQYPEARSLDGWEEWHQEIAKKHPIQYFVRETCSSFRYGFNRTISDVKYFIKAIFKPCHADIRKAIPREWYDICSLVIDVNFAMIVSFKKEAEQSHVDWNGAENHQKFKAWLDAAHKWITVEKPKLEKEMEEAYPPYPLPPEMKSLKYPELYGKVNEIAKIIEDTDTKILKEMVDYREYMWT